MRQTFFFKLRAKACRLFTKSNWIILMGLIRANFKASDYGTLFGIGWSLINPIVMLAVMYFMFKTNFGNGIKDYSFYILIGIIVVNFFGTTTAYMIRGFLGNRQFILNSMIPRECLIASQLFIHVYKFIIECIFCFCLSLFLDFFSWQLLFLFVPLCFFFILFAAGVGLILSLLYCLVKDIEHIWMMANRLIYFVTPVFFTMESISPLARKLVYYANPLTPFMMAFRGLLMRQFDGWSYMYSIILGVGFFTLSYTLFLFFENVAVESA